MDKEQRLEKAKEILLKHLKDVDEVAIQMIPEIAFPLAILHAMEEYASHQSAPSTNGRPKVVCYCGSIRKAKEAFEKAEYESLMRGEIALLPCCMYVDIEREYGGLSEYKVKADESHKRKIDMADEVFILDVDGYIGESTRSEIEYAKSKGKPIKYLSGAMELPGNAQQSAPSGDVVETAKWYSENKAIVSFSSDDNEAHFDTNQIVKAFLAGHAHKEKGAGVWVRASDFKYKPSVKYFAKWPLSNINSIGWFQESDGTFFWSEPGYVPVGANEHKDLLILDESPSQDVQVLVDSFNEYIKLLEDECSELAAVSFARSNGWKSTRYEAGKKCRENITQALNQFKQSQK